jgi:PAP2 superfamily
VCASRIVAHSLPFRERPLREQELHFHLPYGMNSVVLEGWSSFPSDHAAFFFALAVTFLFVCRRAGIFAIVYSGLVVCLPRIYLGIHYPSDIAAGVLIGTGAGCLSSIAAVRQAVARPALRYVDINPAASYGCLSVLTYLIGTVCEPVPRLIRFVFAVVAGSLAGTGHPLDVPSGRQSILEPLAVGLAAVGVIAALTLLGRRRLLVLLANDPEATASLPGKDRHGG